MSKTLTSIPFFSGDIVIEVLSCTRDEHINREMSLDQFAEGQRLRLERVEEDQEYLATRDDGAFIQGPEVS